MRDGQKWSEYEGKKEPHEQRQRWESVPRHLEEGEFGIGTPGAIGLIGGEVITIG